MPRSSVPEPVLAVASRVNLWRDRRLSDPRHSDRVAAILGAALGISFVVCFVTGLLSHAIQHPPSWFSWTTRPAGLYRVTQGLHVATGIASIPLLFAKLWSVFPRLFRWPVATGVLHAVERLSLLPLVGGSLFMLVTGLANIELWYPWVFFFPAGHYAVSFVVMGALLIHIVSKLATTRRVLTHGGRSQPDQVAFAQGRRRFLSTVGAVSAGAVIVTVGQTVSPLRGLALLAPRRPDIGVQGFPVNKTAREAGVTSTAADPSFTLTVEAGGAALRVFTLDELHAMATRTATLPIACVEGWSANRTWRGIRVGDILEQAGAPGRRSVSVESLQRAGRYRRSILTRGQIADADTLLAFEVDGEPLHLDHGFPLRLISPNRPGVMQTKWVGKLVVQ
ncbi:MAG TPA: molybdopterin-dependent oxidoreductase [Ilumatobacteraceae bacterium]|nr:molybdopterin-dependent oxidoreductase [Ilumatobacteraceae bacterium]